MIIYIQTKTHKLPFKLEKSDIGSLFTDLERGQEFIWLQDCLIPVCDITLIASKDQLIKMADLMVEEEDEENDEQDEKELFMTKSLNDFLEGFKKSMKQKCPDPVCGCKSK